MAAACAAATPAAAQPVESVGSRALGMGGAFVAVANDSSATWWNPGALAAGPFLDVGIAHAKGAIDEVLPAAERGVWSISAATLPFGLSYHRLQLADVRSADPTAQVRADRQDRRAGTDLRSLSVSQFGATILHTLLPGIHAGTTVKFVRGTARSGALGGAEATDGTIADLLDRAAALDEGDSGNSVDLDVGVLGVMGAFRGGLLIRNLAAPEFGGIRLPRQVRIGAAFDGDAARMVPLMLAVDADLTAYETGSGERRNLAFGAERWLREGRVGVRGGFRVNTAGFNDRAVTAGASISPRAGLFIDGHVVAGGDEGEAGWGVASRVSF
jgi:hypothetical protein